MPGQIPAWMQEIRTTNWRSSTFLVVHSLQNLYQLPIIVAGDFNMHPNVFKMIPERPEMVGAGYFGSAEDGPGQSEIGRTISEHSYAITRCSILCGLISERATM